ncbi:MaoC family dehydratase [Sphingobium algorifonticola]|uniref:MaoC family dehydratase n=1 Tax=Sphingobium algorifonticola TaxID=2008318 RepID=A0A437J5Y3_9SPHN|nr:MaoC family dehydratase [Sphingobium algorifonticola]
MIEYYAPAEGQLRVSDWLVLDQDRLTTFGEVTLDPDPLHVDPDFAREHGPFGTTISFGFLTASLLTYFFRQSLRGSAPGYALNYGFNRLRLPQVVPVGSRVRGVFGLLGAEDRGAGKVLMRYDTRVEIEGEDKPALVAEWLTMWVDDGIVRKKG